ncbi:arginine--tRNA ligase [Desulfurivibrio alkaliphilus]|uniref:Arginine--tRNA ligase n=1 Tax=Desulfurivibrio alkaliphilus (strain DSM 19089 / UNIQEM U267 / AHT2) TaxID=589865 RepID=D6Z483_DESAT|nr:arginine--tRNA ligase [Desulfurivibrio alkaliphilus]ADH86358.1 arginyl-tRNA synthetase [Desulfurivibrio alkaliphilus AHT 2]
MIRTRVQAAVDRCFALGVERDLWTAAAAGGYAVEEPKRAGQGDFATNLAMVVAGREKRKPREIAEALVGLLSDPANNGDLFARVEVAGPGFVNCFVKPEVWQGVVPAVLARGEDYGRGHSGEGRSVLVEFVSANPTGPLSVGHGRQAVLGDAIARLLTAVGYRVTREYYYNDAGRQMRVLGESVQARYLELLGRSGDFPEDGYQGEYIREIAQALVNEQGEALKDAPDHLPFTKKAEEVIFADINATLARLGIKFDHYYNEHTLYEQGLVDDVVASLRDKGLVYDQDGAVWFKTTEFGLEQDRVIIKSSGEPTYRLPDIAYHREKMRRGYDWLVNVLGSDHIATVPDVMAGLEALGYDSGKVTTVIHQFVTLMREGQQVKMSTRKATFVTVDELLDLVGADVARFFFLMRKADSQLEFDLDLATKEGQENPVYYVQYAHARLCSIERQAREKGVVPAAAEEIDFSRLEQAEELDLLQAMAGLPSLLESAAGALEPHRVVFYLQDMAAKFHGYYNRHRIVGEDLALSQARLALARALRVVFANGLQLIGVSAPESM